jgi:hypothetical protein
MSMAQPGVVAPWRAAYVPGDWYVIAGPTSLVVLQPGPGRTDMIADLWADVVASASMSDLVDRLAGYGITELPDLAVVFWSAAGMRSLVRGGVWLDDPSSGEQVGAGEGVVTWNEVGLEHLESVRIRVREQPTDGEVLPLAVGVARVGTVVLSADETAAVRSPQPLLRSAASGASAASAATAAGANSASGAAAGGAPVQGNGRGTPVAGVVGGSAATALAESARSDGSQGSDRPGGSDADSVPSGPALADQRADPDVPEMATAGPDEAWAPNGTDAEHEPSTSDTFDGQDDDTGPDFPPIQSDDDEPSETGESPSFGLGSEWGPQPAGEAGAGVVVGGLAAGTAGLAPGATGSAGALGAASPVAPGPLVSAPSPTEFSREQFEMENDDTQLMANPVVVGPDGQPVGRTAPATTEPLIEAVRCSNGHVNAPGATVCRVCRTPLAGARIELVPEPLIARLRAADGTLVDLDRALLLGRAPSEQRSTVPLPRLVTLASPAQDISRTHLQVVPENWQVVVTDLNSTNGTFVTDPGPGGNRGLLPPGQPTPVPIGAVLELGEGVTLTIEPGD